MNLQLTNGLCTSEVRTWRTCQVLYHAWFSLYIRVLQHQSEVHMLSVFSLSTSQLYVYQLCIQILNKNLFDSSRWVIQRTAGQRSLILLIRWFVIRYLTFMQHLNIRSISSSFASSPSFAFWQVSEFGWGEFEAGIRIFFRDPEEQPIDLIHQIKLYPAVAEGPDTKSANAPPPQNSKKPVVSEQYDEVVFTDPTENFKRLLMLYSPLSPDMRTADAVGMVSEHMFLLP